MPAESFAALLRRLRTATDLSQEELAERARVAARTVSDLERGVSRTARRDTARLLAEGLGLTGTQRAAFLAAARGEPAGPLTVEPPGSAGSAGSTGSGADLVPPVTELVGRADDLRELVGLLGEPAARLVTVTGPGGVGKTRLALAAAAAAEGFDEVVAVALAELTAPGLVLDSVASGLGVRAVPGQSLDALVADRLTGRRTLLVLDNCEHLLAGVAVEVSKLLAGSPALWVLATSRAPLRLRAERRYPLRPLTLPDPQASPAELAAAASVDLYLLRARAATPGWAPTPEDLEAVAEICRRLDGLPLAIELAAAWSPVLDPVMVATRLGHRLDLLTRAPADLPVRQQTLRATLDWSHALLGAGEQAVLRRLAVFAGPFRLDACREVLLGTDPREDAPAGPDTVLDGLATLVEHGLLRRLAPAPGPGGALPRFALLETVREYAAERLEAAGERQTFAGRHARYYHRLATRAEPALRGPEQQPWLARLDGELANLRCALGWSLVAEPETAAGLAAALWRYWELRGRLAEGRDWLDRALSAGPGRARAGATWAAGALALDQGEADVSRRLLAEAHRLAEATGDLATLARAENSLGTVAALVDGDPAAALRRYEASLGLFRALDEPGYVAGLLNNLGLTRMQLGQPAAALALLRESEQTARAVGSRHMLGRTLHSLGSVLEWTGDVAGAAAAYREGGTLLAAVGDGYGLAHCLGGLARLAVADDPARAARLLAAQERLRAGTGTVLDGDEQAKQDVALAAVRAVLPPGVLEEQWSLGERLPAEDLLDG